MYLEDECLYHSTLKTISIKYEDNNVNVEAEANSDIARKWTEKFFSLV